MNVSQIENKTLEIHDKNRSTEGGPPAWLAFTFVFIGLLPMIMIGLGAFLLFRNLW